MINRVAERDNEGGTFIVFPLDLSAVEYQEQTNTATRNRSRLQEGRSCATMTMKLPTQKARAAVGVVQTEVSVIRH